MRRWAGGRALPALQGRGILQRGVPGGGVEGRAQITVRQDARRAATRAAQQALGGGEACHGHRRRRGRRDAGPPHAQVREHASHVRRVQCVAAAQQRQRQAAPPGHRAGGRARKRRPPRWGACTKEQAARRREGIAGRCAVPAKSLCACHSGGGPAPALGVHTNKRQPGAQTPPAGCALRGGQSRGGSCVRTAPRGPVADRLVGRGQAPAGVYTRDFERPPRSLEDA